MKKTIAFVGQVALVAVVIFCIYYGIFSSFTEKIQIVIDAYYNPQIPENILAWSETVSGIIFLIISAVIVTILIINDIFFSKEFFGFLFVTIFYGIFFSGLYLLIAEIVSGSNDIEYHYKQLLLVVSFTLGLSISILTSSYETEVSKEEKLGYIKALACSAVPLLHGYLLLRHGFTYALVTTIFFSIVYNLICQTILVIHWSFKRLSSYQ